ncbi:DUF3301 domain-containing protein [Haliea sp. E17]|uniref:DUF3301 domain-containing protein n=1 Tax=Haliea sp. E17 TaxID=3401576 RepID=UPI003AAB35CA
MYISLGEVVVLFMVGAAALYVFSSIRIRELALQHVQSASQRDGFQLLDESVQIQKMSLSRDRGGQWRVWRQYRFEYSLDGVERRQGHVIMLGRRLVSVVVSERPRVLH